MVTTLGDLQSLTEVGIAFNLAISFTPEYLGRRFNKINKQYATKIYLLRKYSPKLQESFPDSSRESIYEIIDFSDQESLKNTVLSGLKIISIFSAVILIFVLLMESIYASNEAGYLIWFVLFIFMVLPSVIGVYSIEKIIRQHKDTIEAVCGGYLNNIEEKLEEFHKSNTRPEFKDYIKRPKELKAARESYEARKAEFLKEHLNEDQVVGLL